MGLFITPEFGGNLIKWEILEARDFILALHSHPSLGPSLTFASLHFLLRTTLAVA